MPDMIRRFMNMVTAEGLRGGEAGGLPVRAAGDRLLAGRWRPAALRGARPAAPSRSTRSSASGREGRPQQVGAAGAGEPYRRWGLTAPRRRRPRARPPRPPPAARPARRAPALLPVVDRVPTRDKVVFLTYDDGAERDPRFVDMVRELRLPVSMFLTDSVVGPGYGHFARLRAVGAAVQNHTLDHTALRGLPYAGQRAEICGQQNKLKSRFGVRPRLFRPPYGAYDTTTLRAAADCGITAVVLWRASMDDADLTLRRRRPPAPRRHRRRGPGRAEGST